MERIVELAVRHPIEGRAVDFSPVTAAIGQANARILAMTAAASSAGRMMNIRMLVENPASAITSLGATNISVVQNEALTFKVENRPNALMQVTAALGQANTQIIAMTAAASTEGRLMNVRVLVENPASALDALQAPAVA